MNTYYNFISLENENIETARAYYLIKIADERSFKFCASPVSPHELNMDPYTHIKSYWPMSYSSIMPSHRALLFPDDPENPDDPIKKLRSEPLSRDDISLIFGMDPTIIQAYPFGRLIQSKPMIESLINSLTINHERLQNYICSELQALSVDSRNLSTIHTVILQTNDIESLLLLINSMDITTQSHTLSRLAFLIAQVTHDDIACCTKYIPSLLKLLESDDQTIQRHAHAVLSRVKPNYKTFYYMQLLLPLVNSISIRVQSRILSQLARVISVDQDLIAICTPYIPSLLKLLESDDQKIQRDASYVLSHLARHDENKKIIRHQNGIRPLLALLADRDKEAYHHALSALRYLSSMRATRKEILKTHTLSSLINGLDSYHPASIMITLNYFLMDVTTFIQGDIFTNKNIALIVLLLWSSDQEMVRHTACALSRIARIDQHRITIFNENGLRVLVDLLKTNHDVQTRRYITTTLSQFSYDNRHNTVLIRQLQHTMSLSMLLTSQDPDTQYYAAVMVQNLSCHDENRFFSRRIISELIHLLSSHVDRITIAAAYALGNLAQNDEKSRFILDEKGIPLFFDLLESSSIEKKRSAIYALSLLSRHAHHHDLIFSLRGIAKIMLLLTSCDIKTKSYAIDALAHLVKDQDTLNSTYSMQAMLTRLIPLLTEKDQEIQRSLTYILSMMTQRAQHRHIFYDTQSMTPLIHLLTSSDRETRGYAARTLSQISFHHESAKVMSNPSNIQWLIDLLRTPASATEDILTKRYVTSTLSSLALIRKNKTSIRQAHGIKALIATLASADVLTMRYAALALGRLALDLDNQIQIRREKGLLPLISLLSFPDSETQYDAVKALAFLSINQSNQNIICCLSSMSALGCLMKSNQPLTRRYALLTISNLTRHSINAVIMREANMIEALISCLFSHKIDTQDSPCENDDRLIKHYAFIALKNLARDEDNRTIIKRKVSLIDRHTHPWDPISEEYIVQLSKITDIKRDLLAHSMFRDVPAPELSVGFLLKSMGFSWS